MLGVFCSVSLCVSNHLSNPLLPQLTLLQHWPSQDCTLTTALHCYPLNTDITKSASQSLMQRSHLPQQGCNLKSLFWEKIKVQAWKTTRHMVVFNGRPLLCLSIWCKGDGGEDGSPLCHCDFTARMVAWLLLHSSVTWCIIHSRVPLRLLGNGKCWAKVI